MSILIWFMTVDNGGQINVNVNRDLTSCFTYSSCDVRVNIAKTPSRLVFGVTAEYGHLLLADPPCV